MDKVLDTIANVAKHNKLKLDLKKDLNESLRTLKIDSLAAMNLIMQIEEKLNVTLSDETLMSIKTLNDLIQAFENALKK